MLATVSELWHYFWKTKGGTHIGNRGLGMWKNYLFMETPDDYLVSLDAKTGKERWHKLIADVDAGLLLDAAPVVVGNHVLVERATISTLPASCNPSIPRPANCNGSLYGADG